MCRGPPAWPRTHLRGRASHGANNTAGSHRYLLALCLSYALVAGASGRSLGEDGAGDDAGVLCTQCPTRTDRPSEGWGTFSRRLKQQSMVFITEGPLPNAYTSQDEPIISFRVEGFSVQTNCSLRHGRTVVLKWQKCASPYKLQHLKKDGSYTFQVQALTGTLLPGGRASVRWTVDRSPPDTQFMGSLPDKETADNSAFLEFSGTDGESVVKAFECSVDSEPWDFCTSGVAIEGLSPGLHTARVRSVDKAGNVDPTPIRHTWVVIASTEITANETSLMGGNQDPQATVPLLQSEESDDDGNFLQNTTNIAADNVVETVSILLVILLVIILCSLWGCLVCWRKRKNRKQERLMDLERQSTMGQSQRSRDMTSSDGADVYSGHMASLLVASLPDSCKRFTYNELFDATGGFNEAGVIGEGGFGKVYRGTLKDGTQIAVKKLEKGGQQGDKEFFIEVTTLARMSHNPYLVKLVGACVQDNNRLCVFDLMEWGNLRELLDIGDPRLTWDTRVKIAIDAAKGLAYMHGSSPPVVHRDFKSANVLLNRDGQAHISDFGLSTIIPRSTRSTSGATAQSSSILGTFGYVAPEYASTGRVSPKSDVYSYGVVMLELLTGRPAVDMKKPEVEQILVQWLLNRMDMLDEVIRAADPAMEGQVAEVQLVAYVELAGSCLSVDPQDRPDIKDVSTALEQLRSFGSPEQIARSPTNSLILSAGRWSTSSAVLSAHRNGARWEEASPPERLTEVNSDLGDSWPPSKVPAVKTPSSALAQAANWVQFEGNPLAKRLEELKKP